MQSLREGGEGRRELFIYRVDIVNLSQGFSRRYIISATEGRGVYVFIET